MTVIEVKPHRWSFSGTWFRRYRRTEMELGGRVSFPRGFQGGRASGNTLRMAIAPVHYHLSLPCVEQKRHNPSRKLLEYHR